MSGESAQHAALVARLITIIRGRHNAVTGTFMLADHHSFGNDRPPRIGGFTPDIFVSDLPDTFRVLGEAKTPGDLESDRSLRQIAAFLDHLALRQRSTFYLAVPWLFIPRAQFLLRSLCRDEHAGVEVHVISGNL